MKAIRLNFHILALVCCCLFTACHHNDDDNYKAFSKTYYRHGQLWSGKLKQPMIVQSYPCTDRVSFNSAGQINQFMLSKDHEIRGNIIPEKSIVEFENKIMSVILSRPVKIQGYLIPGGEYIYTPVNFDKYGNLIYFVPEDDIEIDSIPCRGLREVQLYPGGKLWVCFLSRDFNIDGTLYMEGTFLIFDENGKAQEYSYELYQDIRERLDL